MCVEVCVDLDLKFSVYIHVILITLLLTGSVASQPLNATEYLLRLYIDGFYSSEVNIKITTVGNVKKLSYVTPVLNMSHDGTTYDICTQYVCLPTVVYLRDKGKTESYCTLESAQIYNMYQKM